MPVVLICETPKGCTCGAPADTPRGMHHCDCAISFGRCREAGCALCERDGLVSPPGSTTGGDPR